MSTPRPHPTSHIRRRRYAVGVHTGKFRIEITKQVLCHVCRCAAPPMAFGRNTVRDRQVFHTAILSVCPRARSRAWQHILLRAEKSSSTYSGI